MQIPKVERKNIRLRLALAGLSGSGKTFSALLISFGLTEDWEKISVIDTENGSAELYAALTISSGGARKESTRLHNLQKEIEIVAKRLRAFSAVLSFISPVLPLESRCWIVPSR